MSKKLTKEELKELLGVEFLAFFIGLAESASERARGFFKEGEQYDRTVGATVMRWSIRDGLRDAAKVLYTEETHGFIVQSPRNLAIWFEYEGLLIRGYTVPKGKLPLRGQHSPGHRENHFANRPQPQQTIFSKPWVANVSFLWSFDKHGNFIGLRAVIGDGWNEAGVLQASLDLELPTTASEIRAEMEEANFKVDHDTESLISREIPQETINKTPNFSSEAE